MLEDHLSASPALRQILSLMQECHATDNEEATPFCNFHVPLPPSSAATLLSEYAMVSEYLPCR